MRVAIIDVDTLSRNWWLVVLRGVLGIAFGIITFVAPAISLAALVLLFGAYAFADGVLAIATAVRRRGTTERWWILLLEGLVGIGAGLVTLFLPGITALVLPYIIAGWAVATGILELIAAVRLRRRHPDHPRGYRAPILVALCGVGFAASLAALLVGFIPPSQFGGGSPWVYLLIVGGGALGLGLLVPFLFYRFRRPSWKQPANAEVSES